MFPAPAHDLGHAPMLGRGTEIGVRIARAGSTLTADAGQEVRPMKLAEALAVRSDATRRFEQLRSRAQANARYQEGEPPAEDARELLAEADRVLAELEDLIRRINRTNAATMLDEQTTVTDAIARR